MKMKVFTAGLIDANNYLVWDETSKNAVLIDCSDYVENIVNTVKENNLNVKYILLTHGHFDHVMGVNSMSKALQAEVGVGLADVVMLDNINEYGQLFGLPELEPPKHDFIVKNGDVLDLEGLDIKVIQTPGHTEGGVCYLVNNSALFSGDTLFRGTYGRTDLFGGDFAKIRKSLKDVIFNLDDSLVIYPGHGEPTTLEYEKKYNDINR